MSSTTSAFLRHLTCTSSATSTPAPGRKGARFSPSPGWGPAPPSSWGFLSKLTVNLKAARSPAPPAAAPIPGPTLQRPRWLGHRAPRLAGLGLTPGGAQEKPMELQAVAAAAAAGAATARTDDAQAPWGGAQTDDAQARAVS